MVQAKEKWMHKKKKKKNLVTVIDDVHIDEAHTCTSATRDPEHITKEM